MMCTPASRIARPFSNVVQQCLLLMPTLNCFSRRQRLAIRSVTGPGNKLTWQLQL